MIGSIVHILNDLNKRYRHNTSERVVKESKQLRCTCLVKRHIVAYITVETKKILWKSRNEIYDIYVYGRKYWYLWSNNAKSPQIYVLFVESEKYVLPSNEISSREVRHRCLFPNLIKELKVGKNWSDWN